MMLSPSNSTSLTSSPSLSNISSIAAPLPMSTSTMITGHYGHSLAAAMGAAGGGEDETEMASLGSYDDAMGSGEQSCMLSAIYIAAIHIVSHPFTLSTIHIVSDPRYRRLA